MLEHERSNIFWHIGEIKRRDREILNRHRGLTIWFTGLSASGKSTLAVATEKALFKRGCHTYILDGDNVRHGLNSDLGFSKADQKKTFAGWVRSRNCFEIAGS